MKRLRQLTRSIFEKGGSLTRFCLAKIHISRIDLLIWNPPSSRTKNRFNRSAEISETDAFGYRPVRARSRTVSLMSVANIWMDVAACEIFRLCAHMYSRSVIAMEYTSSPVEQPATQTRMGSSRLRSSNSLG